MTIVRVRAPASTSNLGGGFDCVGIAVDRWLQVDARIDPDESGAVRLRRSGTLAALGGEPSADLIYRGFTLACDAAGREAPRGLALDANSEIPVGRGFGSSAAALVAGTAAANALLGLGLTGHAMAEICARLEKHGDNVGPCSLGGAVFATLGGPSGLVLAPIAVHPSLRLAFAIPDFAVETHRARAALPATIEHGQACAAAAASAALVLGLARADAELLSVGLEGPLHVPYRRSLVRGYDEVVDAARSAGAPGASLSGSGSAIVAVAEARLAERVAAAMVDAWRAGGVAAEWFVSAPCTRGVEVSRADRDGVGGDDAAEHSGAAHTSSIGEVAK
jgi:homoserine kinase